MVTPTLNVIAEAISLIEARVLYLLIIACVTEFIVSVLL